MNTSTGWKKSHSPTVLVDRCLPDDAIKKGLRRHGITAVTLEDLYPRRGQTVQDVEWLADIGRDGLIALTQNPQIWFTLDERNTIQASGARVFCLASAEEPNEFKSFLFGRWWLPIMRRAHRNGACFWRLYVDQPIRRDLP